MDPVFDILDEQVRDKLAARAQPGWTAPMLATLTHDHFSSEEWIYERKLDGVRCLAFRKGGTVRLLSRNKKEQNPRYPELEAAVSRQSRDDFIVDGEIVAFDGDVTSFSKLQGRMQIERADKAQETGIAVYYYLFDILHLAGHDTTKLPLRERKRLLKNALVFRDPLRFTRHRNTCGEAFLEEACRKGWEGLIAKKADSGYVHDRSRNWLKFKCVKRQEFVIGGYTEPQGQRTGFGALLIGYYDNGRLAYAGKVGTGYDEDTLHSLHEKLSSQRRKTAPFDHPERIPKKGVHWVTPELVAEVAFTEWTEDHRLRHPRYVGLRGDKAPTDVTRE